MNDGNEKWWHVRWRRIGLVLLMLFCSLWGLASFAERIYHQLMPWYLVRETTKDDPHLKLIPVELSDHRVAELTGMNIEFHGAALQAPWTDPIVVHQSQGLYSAGFKSNATLLILDSTVVRDAMLNARRDPQMVCVLGEKALSSSYGYEAEAMAATPADVHWWNSPEHNARRLVLLGMKGVEFAGADIAYKTGFGKVRGFQFGDPNVAPFRVILHLFDDSDGEYTIVIGAHEGKGPVITQAEVNAMVASFTPVAK